MAHIEPDARKPVWFGIEGAAQFLPDPTWYPTVAGVNPVQVADYYVMVAGPQVVGDNPAGTVPLPLGRTKIRFRRINESIVDSKDAGSIYVR